jgi:hypothetical protein
MTTHLYGQVTVHCDNHWINNQQDVSSIQHFILSRNSTCFEHLLCPSSGVISCTRGNWYVSCRLCGRCLGESVWNNLTVLGPKHVEFRDKIKFWILDAFCWLFIRRLHTIAENCVFYAQLNCQSNLYFIISSCRWFLYWHAWWWTEKGPEHVAN